MPKRRVRQKPTQEDLKKVILYRLTKGWEGIEDGASVRDKIVSSVEEEFKRDPLGVLAKYSHLTARQRQR